MSAAVAPLLPIAAGPAASDVLSALPTPVLVIDDGGRIVSANGAAETFLNASQTLLRERGWDALLPPGSALGSLLREAMTATGHFSAYDIEISLIGGMRQRADMLVAPLVDAPGWRTISFQTRSVASMVDRQISHQGAARSAEGVAAMLAHEIKNPLSGIRGAAQLLAQNADPDGQELTDLICAEVDRIAKLVDRMEGFTDTRPLDRAPENIHAILGHVRKVAEQGFARGITVRERYDPSLPAVLGNRDVLIQAFLNLLKNAAEAIAEQGGEIMLTTAYRHGLRVSVRGSDRRVSVPIEICVIDTGPGAPADVEGHLFEPFVSSKRTGTGLGLALVAKVVGDHGGIVEYVRTEQPPRTIFRVLLPMAETRA